MKWLGGFLVGLSVLGCAVSIRDKTPDAYKKEIDNLHTFTFSRDNILLFYPIIEADVNINGADYKMHQNGNNWEYHHRVKSAEKFKYFFLVTCERPGGTLTQRFPKTGYYSCAVLSKEEIIVRPRNLKFLCGHEESHRCASEYVIINNQTSKDILITGYFVSDNSFSVLSNGTSVPYRLACGEEMLLAVIFKHLKNQSFGVLVIKTDHPVYPEIHIDIEGLYNPPKAQAKTSFERNPYFR